MHKPFLFILFLSFPLLIYLTPLFPHSYYDFRFTNTYDDSGKEWLGKALSLLKPTFSWRTLGNMICICMRKYKKNCIIVFLKIRNQHRSLWCILPFITPYNRVSFYIPIDKSFIFDSHKYVLQFITLFESLSVFCDLHLNWLYPLAHPHKNDMWQLKKKNVN